MTATPPPASGGGPTIDRRVTILAACSVLCTVIALVCLGLLVFTGDKDADATTASAGGTDNGSTGDDSPDPDSSRPDNLTDAGWNDSNAHCLTGDPWVYAAEGTPGQVVICVNSGILYPVTDESDEAPDPTSFQGIWPVCPVGSNAQEEGRFQENHADIGWTEYNGTARTDYNMGSNGEYHLNDPANLSESEYDAFWTNAEPDLSTLNQCAEGAESRTDRLLAEYGDAAPSLSTDDEHGGLDLGPHGDGAGAVSPTGKTIEMCEFGLPAGASGRADFSDGTKDFDPVCERIRDEFYAERPYICGESDSTGATAEECEARGQEPLLVYDQPKSLWGNDPRYAPNPL